MQQLKYNLGIKKNRHKIQNSSFQEKFCADPTEFKVELHARVRLYKKNYLCMCLWFSKPELVHVPTASMASRGWEAAGVRRECGLASGSWAPQLLGVSWRAGLASCLGLRNCSQPRSRSWGGTEQVVWFERFKLAPSQVGEPGGAEASMARAPWSCDFERCIWP